LSSGANATQTTLNAFFKESGNATVDKVDGVLGKTQSILEDSGSKYNYTLGASSVEAGRTTLGYAGPFQPDRISLTKEFFDASVKDQITTLVHEPAHLQGKNYFPFQKETYDKAVKRLSGPAALNNADSYAQFAVP
jgi:hypothetical protein